MTMDDDDDYDPQDDMDMEDDEEPSDDFELLDDEAEYLTQRLNGYHAISEEGAEDDADEDEGEPLFDDMVDPMTLLEGMGRQQEGDEAYQEPYEVLARAKRARQQDNAASGLFGATVGDIWNEDMAEKVGMLGDRQRSRRKQREKERRRRRAAAKGIRSKELPEEVTRRLGEANLLYATSRYDEAIQLLLEVIKMAPNLADPYHTLGMLHEAKSDPRKALDFYMIAAHLTPRDISLWRRLANLSTDHGFLRQGIYCLTRVIARDKEDLDARWDRAVLYAQINEPRKALDAFEAIALARPGDSEVVKMLARLYHRVGAGQKAIEVLEGHMGSHPEATDLTDVNILAELYMEKEHFGKAVALIGQAEQRLCAGSGLPIDLAVKAGMCAAHTGDMPGALAMFEALQLESPSDYADLYTDVADMLAEHKQHKQALRFYERLRQQPELSTPELWRKMAACQQALGNDEGAASIYSSILESSSIDNETQLEAAIALAELYSKAGQSSAALEVLRGMKDVGSSDDAGASLGLLNRRAQLLLNLNDKEAFLNLMLPVITSTLRHFDASAAVGSRRSAALRRRLRLINKNRGAHEQGVVFKGFVTKDRRKPHVRQEDEELAAALQAGALSESEAEGDPRAAAAAGGLPGDSSLLVLAGLASEREQFDMLVRTMRVMVGAGQASEALQLADHVNQLFSRRGAENQAKKDVLRLVMAEAALKQGDMSGAHGHIRTVVAHWPHSTAAWNVYARVAAAVPGGLRHNLKFLAPLRAKHPAALPLAILTGHSHTTTGGYAAALNEYFHTYKQTRREPLTLLCMAVAILNQVMSRKVPDRDRTVLQAFAFLQEYASVRRNAQEAAYNIGRAAHQLGLLHLATPFYERALAAEPPPANAAPGGAAASARAADLDLRREAAHNLVLIYKTTGAVALARQVMRQHLVI